MNSLGHYCSSDSLVYRILAKPSMSILEVLVYIVLFEVLARKETLD